MNENTHGTNSRDSQAWLDVIRRVRSGEYMDVSLGVGVKQITATIEEGEEVRGGGEGTDMFNLPLPTSTSSFTFSKLSLLSLSLHPL